MRDIDTATRARVVFYALQWPDEWREYYLSTSLQHHDPLLDALEYRTGPFTWSELRNDRTLPKVGTEALQLAAERGWIEGLVIPIARGAMHYGLVSLAGRKTGLSEDTLLLLSMAGTLFYHRVRLLTSTHGFSELPFGLTPREFDCLVEVCHGRSDREIGLSLHISSATTHEYIQAAKRKLHVRTRVQAIAVAISFGLIHY